MSKGHSQPRTQPPRRNALGRCTSKVCSEDVVIVDVEKGKPEVVDVDDSETSHQWSRYLGRTRTKAFPNVIISIDDEEDDDNYNARNMHGNAASQMFRTTGSSPFCDEFHLHGGPTMVGNGKHHLEQEKREYSTGSPRNRFGLGPNSDSSLSESDSFECETSKSDSSDSEIMEDTSGTIREQWERASEKKRMLGKHPQVSEDEASATGSSVDPGLPSQYKNESTPDYLSSDNEAINSFEEIHGSPSKCKSVNQVNAFFRPTSGGCTGEPPTLSKGSTFVENPSPGDATFISRHGVHQTDSVPSSCAKGSNTVRGVPSPGSILCNSSLYQDIQTANKGVVHHDKDQPAKGSVVTAARDAEASYQENDKPCAYKDIQGEPGFEESDCLFKNMIESSPGSFSCQKTECKEDQVIVGSSQHNLEELSSHSCRVVTENRVHEHGEGADVNVWSDLIAGREKHKDSDEYKRAIEEEWASRRRELQMQAEEAQRLKKRKKAESLRLLEMEKRQRQRIEEIRETQKKDEEAIHLKEKFRIEVRRELDKIEATYRDMASMLRALGIPVGGGPFPLSQEVNNAYKKALLIFHPDRASRTDIRKQVEAEEKFKLISRLRQKLLPVA